MSGLSGAQHVSCTADLQILHGHLEACAEFREFSDCLKTSLLRFGEDLILPVHEIAVSHTVGPAYPSSHLIKL